MKYVTCAMVIATLLTAVMFTSEFVAADATSEVAAPLLTERAKPCKDSRARQFDFWVGSWEVINPDGSLAGHNEIKRILGGCVLQETWTGRSGSAGTSLNFFDTQRGKWRQFWVWREGTTLELEGALVRGTMVMEGESIDSGKRALNRISWTPRSDGSVRQLWEVSADGGGSWKTLFDGNYVRLNSRAAT